MTSVVEQTKGNVTYQEIIEVAEKHLGTLGLTDFQVAPICKELGISPSVVNYHFKGRDELIARAAYSSYKKYVTQSWELAKSFAPDSEKALSAWIKNQVDWASANPGVAACINFPTLNGPLSNLMKNELGASFSETGSISLINLATLVRNIRDGSWSETKTDPKEVFSNHAMMIAIAKFGWMTLGLSTWVAGRHLPSSAIPQTVDLLPVAMEATIKDIITECKSLPK